jgi:meso-butanediol dehydrogenase / (S,S)-butanediol dehydrogenase / diacetyl reductase
MVGRMSLQRFADRVVYVTGAGGGLGRATAELFGAEGAKVFAVDLDGDALTATVKALRASGVHAFGGVSDVADLDSVEGSIEYAAGELGGIDVLVNVAGYGRALRFEEIGESEWQRTIAVNMTGPFNTMKAALPHLLKGKKPNIVNVASIAGMRGQAYTSAYSASKAGLINFTRSIALEFASRGLRANCIAPGGIKSKFIQHFIPRPDFEPQLVAYYSPPVPHQLAEPADLAKQIAFLASDDAVMINGAVLVGDWGTLA